MRPASGFCGRLDALAADAPGKPARHPANPIYVRNAEPKGPMTVFGYDYLVDHLGDENARQRWR